MQLGVLVRAGTCRGSENFHGSAEGVSQPCAPGVAERVDGSPRGERDRAATEAPARHAGAVHAGDLERDLDGEVELGELTS